MGAPNEKDIKWMYEGPKSLVNREDYLLGKKIDKNFELYSDVVIKEKDEGSAKIFKPSNSLLHTSTPTGLSVKTTVLDVGVVRTEDPLVAIKLQQEQRKRSMLENPLLRMKAERVLREAYEKEFSKKKKKKEKKSRKSKPDRGESDDETVKHKKKKRSSSSCNDEEKEIKRHHHSESFRKHGSKKDEERSVVKPHSSDKIKSNQKSVDTRRGEPRNSHSRSKLTEEELEAKRQAMMSNAKWRDDVRKETIEKAKVKLKAEEEELEKAQSNFLRPNMGNVANSSSSVAHRLQTKRHTLQRSHDCMERSFASRK